MAGRAADVVLADSVDGLLASWAQVRPDLDVSPVAVVSRLSKVRAYLDRGLDQIFESFGLSAADFAALVTLARLGGRGVSQQRLAGELDLTPGTVSVRVDRLVEQDWAKRSPDPHSKRNVLIELTRTGRDLFEAVVPIHLANEARLLAALTDDERDQLAGLLRKLLAEFEGIACRRPALGLVLDPAHETMRLRNELGLEPTSGLLVRSVDADSPSDRAGIRQGDVVVSAGGVATTSAAALLAAVFRRRGKRLRVTLRRGSAPLEVTLDLREVRFLPMAEARSSQHHHHV
jgi:DNA-binding MarR family transcriptional regulator